MPEASYHPGQKISDKYQLEREIGAGAMGSVWLANHLTLGQRVAVKLISREYAHSREARARFDNEAKAAASLRSRFVVQVFDNGETADGTPYIVMEYLEGESLEDRIHRSGAIELEETVRIASQVARALDRAHALGIVHRDLKPANIFLATSHDDDETVAKVLDFGVAKLTNEETSTTRTGSVIGTPQFMSPEQVRGLKSVDHRTDIYALGMIAYTMLTGRVAFSGEAFGDLLLAICTQPLPSIHQENPALPPSLDGWFQRACAREAEQRFQTATDQIEMLVVAAGLGRGVEDVPELVPQPSTFAQGATTQPDPNAADTEVDPLPTSPTQQRYETVGTATMPAGVPKPAGPARLLVAIAVLMLLGGIGLGLVLYFVLPLGESETEVAAPAAAPTTPNSAETAMESPGEPEEPAKSPEVSFADKDKDKDKGEAEPAAKEPAKSTAAGAKSNRQAAEARARRQAKKAKAAAEKLRKAAEKAKKAAGAKPPKPPADPDVGF